MAKKAAANPDELVKQALVNLATAETPLRLTGKGEHPPLFAKTNADVFARLKDEAQPLIAEVGSGKTATVKLTSAGFALIADALPEDKLGPAAKQLALSLPLTERIAFLQEIVRRTPPAAAELLPVIEAATLEERTTAEAHAKEVAIQRQRDAATLEALEKWKAVTLSRKASRIEALKRELAAEGAEPDEEPQPKPRKPETTTRATPTPATPEDSSFQRQVARRLVSSWLETWTPDKPEVRQFLEAAIWNVSQFRQVGDVGELVKFDGRYHEGGAGLFTNSPAKVTRPGWVLQEGDDGEYVLAKAQVVPN